MKTGPKLSWRLRLPRLLRRPPSGSAGLSAWLKFGPNQVALMTALRATLAIAGPVIALDLLGYPGLGLFAGIAGLQTSIADGGSAYSERLRAMATCAAVGASTLFLGTQIHGDPLWSAVGIFAIAFASGMARAFGQTGTVVGLIGAIAFLIGTNVPTAPLTALLHSGVYMAGALWTMIVALLVWRIRPYRRLEVETGLCLEATALLLAVAAGGPRRRESELRRRELAVRSAIEQARASLGATRELRAGNNPTASRLLVLIRAASRFAVAAMNLHDLRQYPALTAELDRALRDAGQSLQRGVERAAATTLYGRGNVGVTTVRSRIRVLDRLELAEPGSALIRDQAMLVLEQAVQHLDNAAEALDALFDRRQRTRHRLLPPLNPTGRAGTGSTPRQRLKAHLSRNSLILRHALRLAIVVTLATVAFTLLALPNGFLLPLTIVVVLQPDFGATMGRALGRTGGTVAGVAVAGALGLILHSHAAIEAVIVVLSFCAFLAFRESYGLFVAGVTPMVILLLELFEPSPWQLTLHRLIDTGAGAAVALAAGYLLWPRWSATRLPEQIGRSLDTLAAYLRCVFEAAANGDGLSDAVLAARREAEIQVGNSETVFQQMLAEPRHRQGSTARWFALVTYLQRLTRHLGALAGRLERDAAPLPELTPLTAPLSAMLDETADELRGQAVPNRGLPLKIYREARDALRARTGASVGLEHLLGAVVSDVNSLSDATHRF